MDWKSAAFGALLAVAAGSAAAPAAAQGEKVAISMASGVNFVSSLVGREKGFFAKEGVDVTLKPVPRGSIAVEALVGGSVQIAEVAHVTFFAGASKGLPLVSVGVGSRGFTGKMVASNANAGLTSLADFKGKRIGIQVGTGVHGVFQMLLDKQGLKESDFEVANVRVTDMPTAMATPGAFDAVIGWDPMMQRIVQAGYGKEVISARRFEELADITYPLILITTRAYLEAKPAVVQGVVNAYAAAHRYIREHRDEAVRIYTDYMAETGATLDEDMLRVMMFEVDKFGGAAYSDGDWRDMRGTLDFLTRSGQIETPPALDAVVDRSVGERADKAVH
ncbi:ABC transporter substrate-binding protein [Azospirillum sp. ST 5-10]|uniref:ABC transporter substrate-binding protein n=1 Tax=unclassified Azospirillum TaxID=2630922 RepID=UPI003F4A6570